MNIKSELLKILEESHTAPFLFVGTGVSRRYLNLPDWGSLLKEICKVASDNEYYYNSLVQDAKTHFENEIDYMSEDYLFPKIAQLLQKQVNSNFYKDERYKKYIEKYNNHLMNDPNFSPFKLIIKHLLDKLSLPTSDERALEEIKLLESLSKKGVHGIITTNYDSFMDDIFKNFRVYKGQKELLLSNIQNIGEIYKIHGCLTEYNNLIITLDDYKNFEKKYAYLAAKLLTIFVEHPIIFLGYSISDPNIKSILKSISECIGDENATNRFIKKLIFIEWKENLDEPEISTHSINFGESKQINIKKFTVKYYHEIFEAIMEKKRMFPTYYLQMIKNDLYKIATEINMDNLEKVKILDPFDEEKTEFVMGVSIEQKVKYFLPTLEEVYIDIIFNNMKFPIDDMVEKALPYLLKHHAFSVPFHKYLSKYVKKEIPDIYLHKSITKSYREFIPPMLKTNSFKLIELYKNYTVKDFFKNEYKKPISDLKKFMYLNEENINLDDLLEIIRNLFFALDNPLEHKNITIRSDYRKLVKIYDFLKYKKN